MADLFKVMQREMLHSEHAAQCYLEAKRRDSAMQQGPKPPPPPRGCQECGYGKVLGCWRCGGL